MKTDQARPSRFRFFSLASYFPFFLIFGLLALTPVYGQGLQITNFSIINTPILRVSDFNITGSGSVAQLFTLQILNTGPATNAVLRFEFRSQRYTDAIVTASTKPFPMASNQARTFTYQDFRGRGANADVAVDEFNYNSESVRDITDAILKTGRLPSDTYFFTMSLSNAANPNAPVQTEPRTLTISNPTSLDLISPGAPVGGGECVAQFGLLPQFKWNSNAERFLLTVCEVLPNNSSPEDVMQNEPRLRRLVQKGLDFAVSPSFIYPSGGFPLQFGETYYWQVQAIIGSPSGEVRLPSEIWCFQISSIGNPGGNTLLQQLLNLLGSSDLEALFEEGGPLHDYTPTGAVNMNGRRLELTELLNVLRNQPIKTVSVQVE